METQEREKLREHVKYYNKFCKFPNLRMSLQEGSRTVACGVLHLHWGVKSPIRLMPQDEVPVPREGWAEKDHVDLQAIKEGVRKRSNSAGESDVMSRPNPSRKSRPLTHSSFRADYTTIRKPTRPRPSLMPTDRIPEEEAPVKNNNGTKEEEEEEFVDARSDLFSPATAFPTQPVHVKTIYNPSDSDSDSEGFATPDEADYDIVFDTDGPDSHSEPLPPNHPAASPEARSQDKPQGKEREKPPYLSKLPKPPSLRRFHTISYRGETKRPKIDVKKSGGGGGGDQADNEDDTEGVEMRSMSAQQRRRRQRKKKGRRFHTVVWGTDATTSINGHIYNPKTCVFTPESGSLASVFTTSDTPTSVVIQQLIDKFKVDQNVDDFGLYIVRETGECRALGPIDLPLAERLRLGPSEDDAKLVIKERDPGNEVSHQVAQYLQLPRITLQQLQTLFDQEEQREVQRLKEKYFYMRLYIQGLLDEKNPHNESKA